MSRRILLLSALTAAAACQPAAERGTSADSMPATSDAALEGRSGAADLVNARGTVVGAVRLEPVGRAIRVIAEVQGLAPGPHGIHFHEVGACEGAGGFASAGDHYSPPPLDTRQHGLENPAGPHAGDLPNLTVGADGSGTLTTETDRLTLSPGGQSVFDGDGTAIVIHAEADDQRTDPSGNSGDRVACGIVR
jgi:Cu-Zn family superoxide dismutase